MMKVYLAFVEIDVKSPFDIWYSAEELAIAHQIRLEIKRQKRLKTTVYPYSSSHHFGVMHDDLMMTSNDDFFIKVITKSSF